MSDSGWLLDLAANDDLDLQEAAALVVENVVTLTAEDWRGLGTEERAALTVARRAARAAALAEAGQDLSAASAYASVDGGLAAARLVARAAGEGVSRARRAPPGDP